MKITKKPIGRARIGALEKLEKTVEVKPNDPESVDTLVKKTKSAAEVRALLSALGPVGPRLSEQDRQELVKTLSGIKSDDPEVNALIGEALTSLQRTPELPGHLAVLTGNGAEGPAQVQATLVRQRREGGAIAYVVRPRDPSVAPYELDQSVGQSLMPQGSPSWCAVLASLDPSGNLTVARDPKTKSRFMAEVGEKDGKLGAFLPGTDRFLPLKSARKAGDIVDLKVDGDELVALKTFARAESPESQLYKIALSRGLDPTFSPEVEAEVAALVKSPGLDDKGLKDLSELPFVTIDNDDSKDLDQAMHIERREDGGYDVYYALADASHYIEPGTALFDEAIKRSSTYYFPGFSVPMLPRQLSEDVVSLNPPKGNLSAAQQEALKAGTPMSALMGDFDQTELLDMGFRRSMVFKISLDSEGKNPSTEVYQAAIRSRAKLSYNGVQASHDGKIYDGKGQPKPNSDYSKTLSLLEELGEKRILAAEERGVVHYNRTNVKVAIGSAENGEHGFMLLKETRNQVEKWNEQISLLCNSEGGRVLKKHSESGFANLQAIFRVHDAPPEGRLKDMERSVNALCDAKGLPDEFRWKRQEQSLADFIQNLPRGSDTERRLFMAIQRQAIMTNVASNFEAEAGGHHGVGAEAYARFSSPMREMVGIFTHKELLEVQRGEHARGPQDVQLQKEVIDAAMAAKSLQKKVNKEANKLAIAALFESQLELPPDERERFKGTIMGFDRNKMYVQLDDPPIEVKVYLSELSQSTGDKFKIHRSKSHASNGEEKVYLGDAIDISCVEIRDGRFILRPATLSS